MSTKGAIGESFFRVRLLLVLVLAGLLAGAIFGNRMEWRRLAPAQLIVVHQYEAGLVLVKLKTCAIKKAPKWIIERCAAYNRLRADPAINSYLMTHARRALIWWPCGTALAIMILGIAGLALKSARFKRLDAHAPRDYFKARRLVVFLDWFSVGLIPVAAAAGWFTHNRDVLLAGGIPALILAALRPWDRSHRLRHIRGARIEDAENVERLVRKQYKGRLGGLRIGDVSIPRDVEVLNFLIAGAPGTGKSTAIAPMIATMRARGDRVFVADARGDYLRRFYQGGDLILNPLDNRSVPWSPLAEIHSASDAAMIARSLVPDAEGNDASWHRFAQLMLEGVLLHALREKLTNADIARLMLAAPLDELRERLGGSAAAGLLPEKSDSPMFHSVRGTASPYLRALGFLAPDAGASSFSLRGWARDESVRSACWWNYQDAQIVGLRTLIATQFDLLSLGVLEQPDSRGRRTWLVVDELPALGRIASLEEFLARARKAGGCAVLGVQSLVQLRRTYGEHSAGAIVSCCSNLLTFALGDAETQEYVSKLLGEQEQSFITRSSSQSDAAAQQTVQRALRSERVLLPSELSPGQLKSRHGFLRMPELPIAPVRLEIGAFEDVAPRFAAREDAPDSRPTAAVPAHDPSPAPADVADTTAPASPAPEAPVLPAHAAPDELLDFLETRRQAGWARNQKQDAAGASSDPGML